MTAWTIADIPPQAGRIAIVTGATGGLGYETALALAGAGATVILAGRNPAKGEAALAAIRARHPAADLHSEMLDLASLASVSAFADRMAASYPRIDLLANNAGVMALPTRQATADGFERQLGTNYLGHFALTLHLLPLLRRGVAPRMVQLSSIAHRRGRLDFDDLNAERGYVPWKAYSQSKLAMLVFALELNRRGHEAGWGVMSNAAHPGWARTDLIANGPGTDQLGAIGRFGMNLVLPVFSQSAAAGALPTLFAATAPTAEGGFYYGPDGFFELKGAVAPARIMPQAKDAAAGARLWEVSEAMTGVRLPT